MTQKLHFDISRDIKTKTKTKEADDSEFDLYFPELIFAVRDFILEFVINGKPVTADEYLEHCLTLLKGDDEKMKMKNLPRICIRKYFKHRRCFLFESPGNNKTLSELENLPDGKLEEGFVKEVGKFVDYVQSQCKPMKVNAKKILNGRSKFPNF